jgi:hypothetical protein
MALNFQKFGSTLPLNFQKFSTVALGFESLLLVSRKQFGCNKKIVVIKKITAGGQK